MYITIPISSQLDLLPALAHIIACYSMRIEPVDFFLHVKSLLCRHCPDGMILSVQLEIGSDNPMVVFKVLPTPVPLFPTDRHLLKIHIDHSKPESLGLCEYIVESI